MKKINHLALRVVLFYGLVASLWILFSDRLLAFFVADPVLLTELQTYKGLAFVLVTTVLFYFMLRDQLRRREQEILGRKQIEAELLRLERKKAGLIDSIDGIVWEADASTFQFTFVSRQAERLLGYPASQWTSENAFWQNHLHPDDRDRAVQFCAEQTRLGTAHDLEYRMLSRDGRVVWLNDVVSVEMENGKPSTLRGVMVDITGRKLAEEELRWKTALMEAQIESAIDGILVVDSQGNKILQNRRLTELWKIPAQVAEEKNDTEQLQFAVKQTKNPSAFVERVAYLYANPDEMARDEIELVDGTILDRYSAPVRDKTGKHYGRIWTFRDVTERRKSEARLEEAQLFAHVGYWERDLATDLVTWSDEIYRIFGLQPQERILNLATVQGMIHPDDRPIQARAIEEACQGGGPYEVEYRIIRPSGEIRFVHSRARTTRDESGRIRRQFGTVQDITERREAEEALRVSENNFRTLADESLQGIAIFQSQKLVYVNASYCAIQGYTAWELKSMSHEQLIGLVHPLDIQVARELIRKQLSGEEMNSSVEFRIVRKDGSIRWVQSFNNLIEFNGQPAILSTSIDITERRHTAEALTLFRSLLDHVNDAIEVIDPETGCFLDVNEQACLNHGYSRKEYLDLNVRDINVSVAACPWDEYVDHLRQQGSILAEGVHCRKDGSSFAIEFNATYVRLDRDYIVAVTRDITERQRAQQQLRASEERFRQLAENINEIFWMTDLAKGEIVYISPAYERIWGRSCQSLYDSPTSWLAAVHPEDRERVRLAAADCVNKGSFEEEYRILRPDLEVRWIRDTAFPVRNASGQAERVVGVARDITDWRQITEQLRQSQKMDAIGHLAGGVAHDFNNILAAVMMQTELLGKTQDLSKEVRNGLQQIFAAAQRAAKLTRQLLLFSSKQVMQARDLDLNEAITSLAKMLERIIGEDVKLELRLQAAPLLIHADPGMVDQVLMNLAVNARDAMLGGGRLLIETMKQEVDLSFARLNPEARPGHYVCVRVSDTGKGIPREILPRIFEPFYTTKEPGKGTGLGLATVFGIVKQHRGFIKVESEPGSGALFQIFFPASKAASVSMDPVTMPARSSAGAETILLVEDEEEVRTLIRKVLNRNGYHTFEAVNGVEAIKLWDAHREEVALLLTDLIMPGGTSGRELAERLQKDKPQLKVVFISGYSAEVAGQEIPLRAGESYLQKPFSADQILQTLRSSLDSQV